MIEKEKRIGEILIERKQITAQQLEEALSAQKATGEKLGEVLDRKGWLASKKIEKLLGEPGVRVFDINSYVIDPSAIGLVPEDTAVMYKIIPVFKDERVLTVAMLDPTDSIIINELSRISGMRIAPILATEYDIIKAQEQCYGGGDKIQEIVSAIDKFHFTQGKKLEEQTSIIRLLETLIKDAVRANASDIHIEPEEKFIGVRYRIDGVLHHHTFLPKGLEQAVTSRIKVMAGLDIAEKRLPQDGHIITKVDNREIDFRVSMFPAIHGENAVLRIFDRSAMTIGIRNLGMPMRELDIFTDLIQQPHGIILVTGPTGSGKTTTLYSALQKLNRESINIMTVEDPVEYEFPRIRQVRVHPKIGLTFANCLRSLVRQDPDVIMVGEIRDFETAEIAVQAALTGHLVFSSLHTNDAPTTFTRLINMKIEPFLVASSLRGVLAQRLLRKICSNCIEPYAPSPILIENLGLRDRIKPETKFFRGRGCERCYNTGYRGRTGVYELLKVTTGIQNLILKKVSANEIKVQAVKEGMKTLREVAVDKLLHGITTPEEVLCVTKETW